MKPQYQLLKGAAGGSQPVLGHCVLVLGVKTGWFGEAENDVGFRDLLMKSNEGRTLRMDS